MPEIKIGSTVKLSKQGFKKIKSQYPGFNPPSMSGRIESKSLRKGELNVNLGGTPYSLPIKYLTLMKSAPRGYAHPNKPTMERIEKFTEKLHGSGIDYNWEINETKTSFRASNAYHTMNDYGMYDSIVPFTVIFPKKQSIEDFKLQFDSNSQWQVQKYGLREFLDDNITFALDGV